MKIKSIVTAIVMAAAFGTGAATVTQNGMLKELNDAGKSALSTESKIFKPKKTKTQYKTLQNKKIQESYFKARQHEGTKRYIVRLVDDSVASYKGGVQGFEKTNASAKKSTLNNPSFNAKSAQSKKYAGYLDQKQAALLTKVSTQLGFNMPKLRSYKYSINGMLTELTYEQAKSIGKMKEVAFIAQEEIYQLQTDTGPLIIGAPAVWDGSAGAAEYQGEGLIFASLDTGVNTDHPSFAATGDDGYTVVNPLGAGNYLGDCVAEPTLCNSKLIGVRSYSEITDNYNDPVFDVADQRPPYGEDYNGHGSHTSGTAVGNVLLNVEVPQVDPYGGNTGDGLPTGYTVARMSGVAPHANIISYQVCNPGNNGDAFSGCLGGPILAAIEDTITDGVDVINYSIGPVGIPQFSPWISAVDVGFLSANAAGIFVATSAGNDGPSASSTLKAAPWYTSVGGTNHGNGNPSGFGGLTSSKSIESFAGGDTAVPADISGGGVNGSFTGDVVYAGDFVNANDPDNDPAQCLEPFPAATFTATQIVVCDRGDIARVAKAENVAAGGAGGFVLANLQDGADSISEDFYQVPGIHISADDGDVLKLWLASGAGHAGTIAAADFVRGSNIADAMWESSSRGPNPFGGVITPSIAAPAASVLAATADETPFHNVSGADATDFNFYSGTSMASPHAAGSALLVKQANPSWNPDQIRSALMMTANTNITKRDGTTPADPFDIGSGRVQVDNAINAGLVMSESEANYMGANPADGGDPTTLNTPSMVNYSCAGSCSWTRTFNVVTDGTYSVSTSSENLTTSMASFDALAGDNVSIDFTLDVTSNATDANVFESVSITAASQPDLQLPVYALVNNGAVPDEVVSITAGRNDGSWVVEGIQTIPTDNLTFVIDGLFDANAVGFSAIENFSIPEDPTNNDYKDILDQVYVFEFDVPVNTVSLNVAITDAPVNDFDLFLEREVDGSFVLVAFSASGATLESIDLEAPDEGRYRVIIQNWEGTGAALDSGTVEINVVPQTDPVDGLTVDAPVVADGNVDVKLLWDIEMIPGDSYFADITVLAGTSEIGTFRTTLDRVEDDFSSNAVQTLVARGETIDYTVSVTPTVYNQDVDYSFSVDMPPNMTLVEGSVVVESGNLTVKNPNAETITFSQDFDNVAIDSNNSSHSDDLTDGVFVFEFDVPSAIVNMDLAISGATSDDFDLFIEYAADGVNFVNQRGFAGATGETNEILSVASPAEGRWRAIVQNYDSTSAPDSGTLSIVLTPARGEGFFWNVSAPGLRPLYTVTSSADDASCAAAGFGSYFSLSGIGFSTTGITGDDATLPLFPNDTFTHFGIEHQGVMINTNGFMMYSGDAGANSWNNLSIPNSAIPNDILASLWKDQIVVDDGTRGIRLGTAGPLRIIDIEGAQSWSSSGIDDDRFTYQVLIFADADSDDHGGWGPFEAIVAYSDTQIGNLSTATAGVENSDGTIGFDVSSMIEPGVQLCYDYAAPPEALEVTFSVIPEAQYSGLNAAPVVTVGSSMVGAEDIVFSASPVELVNVGPTANAGEDITYDRLSTTEVTLNAAPSIDLDIDRLSYHWSQVNGESVELRGSNAQQAYFNVGDVPNGSYTFSLIVDDGEFTSTDQVTITIEGEDGKTNGVGSFGIFLIFLFGTLLTIRRRT